jgi:exopolysaccharide biosynthesis WecB/TagA/CpsF family protein
MGAVSVLVAGLAVPAVAAAGYLLLLALASLRRTAAPPAPGVPPRLVALVPAHDEEQLIERCVASLRAQAYPADRFRIVVVADNCGDGTARLAAAAGAEVLERRDDAALGKGHALRWAMDRLLAAPGAPDGVVVVDADSVADRDLMRHLGAALAAGADVAQAEYLVLADGASTRGRLVAAAFLLFHRVRLGGRAALGLPASLVGNGMLFSRRLLERVPWSAFTGVEDLEYTLDLRLAGFRPRFVGAARVEGPVPHGYRGMRGQRLRWEGGRWHVVRGRLWPLLAHALRRDAGVLDAAVDLAVPPLGLLAMATAAGGLLAAGAVGLGLAAPWAAAPWLAAALALGAFVVVGLLSAGAPAEIWLALLESPRFLAWKLFTYLRIAAGFDARRWERSERPAPSGRRGPPIGGGDGDGGGDRDGDGGGDRVMVAGVPIDRVDTAGAVDRLRGALESDRPAQVATVNLDFLVRAQRHAELAAVLRETELNVADGMPVVWLSRLLGRPVPSRVAGADLVPLLVREAAVADTGIFLLGGEGGVAAAAARRLARELPGLRVDWHEPPRAALDEMDSDGIVAAIDRSGAGLLLVALGNPKQELWIARNRHRLPTVRVAVGVGCVLDLWAGRVRRAPSWMQRSGLEWLHRLAAEPRRLARRFATDGAWLVVIATRSVFQRALRSRAEA